MSRNHIARTVREKIILRILNPGLAAAPRTIEEWRVLCHCANRALIGGSLAVKIPAFSLAPTKTCNFHARHVLHEFHGSRDAWSFHRSAKYCLAAAYLSVLKTCFFLCRCCLSRSLARVVDCKHVALIPVLIVTVSYITLAPSTLTKHKVMGSDTDQTQCYPV